MATNRPRAREDVLFRRVDDRWVVFDPTANRLHELNLTAALVWSHCTGEHSTDVMTEALREAYGIETEQARDDVEATLARFREADLLAGEASTQPE